MANFVHTLRITEMKKKLQHNNQTDVVCHARWRLLTYREDYPDTRAVFDGATPFKIAAADLADENFTCFCDLSEDQVIAWVEANADNLGQLKERNERLVSEELEPSEVSVQSPWGGSITNTGPDMTQTTPDTTQTTNAPTPPEDVANIKYLF